MKDTLREECDESEVSLANYYWYMQFVQRKKPSLLGMPSELLHHNFCCFTLFCSLCSRSSGISNKFKKDP